MFENSETIGICIKEKDGLVVYQNEICKTHCGNLQNSICQKGCMIAHSQNSPESIKQGLNYKGIIYSDKGPIESVIIEDKHNITTIFYDLKDKEVVIENDLAKLKDNALTISERIILREILSGKTKNEIAKKLYVSLSTIKNHINNIYKKLPTSWEKLKERKNF